jgi:uncharacterized protein YjbI with pentapeptide repeats
MMEPRRRKPGRSPFSAVGLYLLATALSTTDEDLLLQHTTSIAQLGVQVPVVFSFAIAPLVFVALHAFALVRYDMLSTNMQQFRSDLEDMVPLKADRERCCQLLTNVEFVVSRAAPYESPLQSRIFRVIAFALIAIFPVTVLMVLGVSALRYQSEGVNWAQRGALVIDLAMLVWLLRRQRIAAAKRPRFGIRWLRWWIGLLWAPVALVAANVAWVNVLGYGGPLVQGTPADTWRRFLQEIDLSELLLQPLDLLCLSPFKWGCRFLTVDHRTLVGHVWKEEAVAALRTGEGNSRTALAAVEGAYLRGRTLRFANLNESRLYSADLIQADLFRASVIGTDLRGADLCEATLFGANLGDADLRGAKISAADLPKANLSGANLRSAEMVVANLYGAHLIRADLSDANMHLAFLDGANLGGANLSGANLSEATLNGTDLRGVQELKQEQLDKACGTNTKLPEGFTLKPCPDIEPTQDSREPVRSAQSKRIGSNPLFGCRALSTIGLLAAPASSALVDEIEHGRR